uniref:Voltagegated Ion Channel (VIC) Superfamily putative n=1 Tax=Albugo laibachii Nc14 TaxID=890382 RepID=F0WZH1_9STRA|nr:Voltagegated Ion Channel (VIC) Superfamily putative [Albugo laibachii Nc14]|eukprot:CCA26891.1 Voltagegated Ion Channel (VIC) Superfamily putative [Albugo laibachii Nc14]
MDRNTIEKTLEYCLRLYLGGDSSPKADASIVKTQEKPISAKWLRRGALADGSGAGTSLWKGVRKNIFSLGLPTSRRRIRKTKAPLFRIDPESRCKRCWDVLVAICVTYTTFVVPYRICFRQDASGVLVYVENGIDVVFAIDIVLHFFTGVQLQNDEILYELKAISLAYIKGWFLLDLLSTLPIDFISKWTGHSSTNNQALLAAKLVRSLKITRLFKLAHVRKLSVMFQNLEDAVYTNQSVLSMIKIGLLMFSVSHLVACLWRFCATIPSDSTKTWVTEFHYNEVGRANQATLQYLASVYWAIVTMATIGYGDIVAQNNLERIVSIAIMAVGVTLFGYVIGTISSLVSNFDASATLYDEQMLLVKEYIISRNMPTHLRARVQEHFEYYYQNRSVFKERRILERLPTTLRNEMIHHSHSKIVAVIKYFRHCHESLISDLVMAMHPFNALKDDYIYTQNEIASHVFFAIKGEASILRSSAGTKKEILIAKIEAGDYFGELEVFAGHDVRIVSAIVTTYSELTFLSRSAIDKVSAQWPEIRRHFDKAAQESISLYEEKTQKSFHDSLVHHHEVDNPATLVMKSTQMNKAPKKQTSIVVPTSSETSNTSAVKSMKEPTAKISEKVFRPKAHPSMPRLPPLNYPASIGTQIGPTLQNTDEGSVPIQHEKRSLPPPSLLPEQDDYSTAKQSPQIRRNQFWCPIKYRQFTSAKYAPTSRHTESSNIRNLIKTIRNSFRARPTRHNLVNEQKLLKGAYILHPNAPSLIIRQIISGAGILYSIIMVPLRLGFDHDAAGGWYFLELGIDLFFFFDILLTFRTAYIDDERVLVISSRRIAIRYMKGSFVPDLLSTLPFDQLAGWFLHSTSDKKISFLPTKLLRLTRVARLLKLVRLIRLTRVFGKIREFLSPSTERLSKLMLLMTLFSHWNACAFHAAVLFSESSGLSNWCVETFYSPQKPLPASGSCTKNIAMKSRYIAALYWAFTTLTTVGYGDIKPSLYSVYELSLVIFLTVLNAIVFGYILACVITLIKNLNPSEREYRLRMTEMKDYLRDVCINATVCKSIKAHYRYNISSTCLFPEEKLFDQMPPSLRFDAARIVATETLFAIPVITVMEDSMKGFVSYILFLLKPIFFRRFEQVCQANTAGTEMFFLVEGTCHVRNPETQLERSLRKTALIEQYALIAKLEEKYQYKLSVTVSSAKCVLYSLSMQGFQAMADAVPSVSTFFLSQLGAALYEDDILTLSSLQQARILELFCLSQAFHSIANRQQARARLHFLSEVVVAAGSGKRRASEWSPGMLPRQLVNVDALSEQKSIDPNYTTSRQKLIACAKLVRAAASSSSGANVVTK